jgi:hypothetical protein
VSGFVGKLICTDNYSTSDLGKAWNRFKEFYPESADLLCRESRGFVMMKDGPPDRNLSKAEVKAQSTAFTAAHLRFSSQSTQSQTEDSSRYSAHDSPTESYHPAVPSQPLVAPQAKRGSQRHVPGTPILGTASPRPVPPRSRAGSGSQQRVSPTPSPNMRRASRPMP